MSRRLRSGLILVPLLLLPFFSSADTVEELQLKINTLLQQIQAVQNQISGAPQASAPTPVVSTSVATSVSASAANGCPLFTRTLGVGARGSDVTQLQVFLKAKGYFSEEATGYFGSLTEAAVKKMQASNGVVASGDAQTTGFGAVGPKTRSLVAKLCLGGASVSAAASTTPAQQCAVVTSTSVPTASCDGTWEKLTNNGCHIGWRCVLPYSGANKPPLVTSIDGPTQLTPSMLGSWKVQALDPEQGTLSYSITWGDEGVQDILSALAGISSNFVSSPTFTHSFSKAGLYVVEVQVRDSAGNIANATISVKVSADAPAVVSTPFTPATTTPAMASCVTPWGASVVPSGGLSSWQPYFSEGSYFATSTPIMKCNNGGWLKCDTAGANCQVYVPRASTTTAALPGYANTVGSKCSPEGSTKTVSVPPGTQLCQWLNCRIATDYETMTLKCTDYGWTDYANYKAENNQ